MKIDLSGVWQAALDPHRHETALTVYADEIRLLLSRRLVLEPPLHPHPEIHPRNPALGRRKLRLVAQVPDNRRMVVCVAHTLIHPPSFI